MQDYIIIDFFLILLPEKEDNLHQWTDRDFWALYPYVYYWSEIPIEVIIKTYGRILKLYGVGLIDNKFFSD